MIRLLRFAVQVVFFVVALLFFLRVLNNEGFREIFTSLHLFPGLIRNHGESAWLWLTVAMLFLPVLAGRLYCSFLCPVGFIQDLVSDISARLKLPRRPAITSLRFPVFSLAACLVLLLADSGFVGYVDHFSHFGRLVDLFRSRFSLSGWLTVLFIISIAVLPFLWPRWFCTVLCPSGALHGLLNQVSFLRFRSKGSCGKCKKCTVNCPTQCIRNGQVDHAFCVTCFECLEGCSRGSFRLAFGPRAGREPFSHGRREFIRIGSAATAGMAFGGTLRVLALSPDVKNVHTVLPPGSLTAGHLFSRCTSCNLCMIACPTHVISPAGLENGLAGFLKPKMNYDRGFCTYECRRCLEVCPTRALHPYPLEEKKRTKMGTAEINEKLCIPFVSPKDCVACAETCPTGAVHVSRHLGVGQPHIKKELCIGCGACQFACPVIPLKAIIVRAERVQGVAAPPEQKSHHGQGHRYRHGRSASEFPF